MLLSRIIEGIGDVSINGNGSIDISELFIDSRDTCYGGCFVCVDGYENTGTRYIDDSARRGARAVIIDRKYEKATHIFYMKYHEITFAMVENLVDRLSIIAWRFYLNRCRNMISVGITGTKGKTTVAAMLCSILNKANKKVGSIGTLGVRYPGTDKYIRIRNTTPDIFTLGKYLCRMEELGCEYIVLEVSSQGLKDGRLGDMQFDYGIFTNISKDHIGPHEHRDMQEYKLCKSMLFNRCRYGIINGDDPEAQYMMKNKKCHFFVFGIKDYCSLYECSMIGQFNKYNSIAAGLTAHYMGIQDRIISEGLWDCQVTGRMEKIPSDLGIHIFVDYAHNHISMKNALAAARTIDTGRIIVVFGCGGNRSRDRRYLMGQTAGAQGDFIIITEDNSRYEQFESIAADIVSGMSVSESKYMVIQDRFEAIKTALAMAVDGDIVMILGKGHEDYIETNGVKRHFSDIEAVNEVLFEMQNQIEYQRTNNIKNGE